MTFTIDHAKHLTLDELQKFLRDDEARVVISENSKKTIIACRNYLDAKMKNNKGPIYGINTGFGSLCDVKVSDSELEQLQENLVKSHACGMGEEVPKDIVKLMLYLKIRSLSYGKSGVQLQTVEKLAELLNQKIYPVIYTQGSLGASGDLAPLAHMSLVLLGQGEVNCEGKKQSTAAVFKTKKIAGVKLQSKEGLALLNGTQFMSAYGVYALLKALRLSKNADLIGAVSVDAFDARIDPFKEALHIIRPHAGQLETAKNFRVYLKDSAINAQAKKQVQDPYSFRCIPQVHGATKDTLHYVADVFETEINSVTDNPTIFEESDEILSGGNFHGQPLALALDFLCIAMAELASISERRTYLLISGQRGLPAYLSPNPGLNSGFMITQYTAAAIVSQNKQLCTPASVDSIVSSNGQEDHVSMGANAATKCLQVVVNSEKVLGIELLNAAQAIEFRRPLKSSAVVEKIVSEFRKLVPAVTNDAVMYVQMQNAQEFVGRYDV